MPRHGIYVNDDVEQLVTELNIVGTGWSDLFLRMLPAYLDTLPQTKVQRAVRRVARTRAQDVVDQLAPSRNA